MSFIVWWLVLYTIVVTRAAVIDEGVCWLLAGQYFVTDHGLRWTVPWLIRRSKNYQVATLMLASARFQINIS